MSKTLTINNGQKVPYVDLINMFFLLSVSGLAFFNGRDVFLVLVFGLNAGKFLFDKRKIDKGFIHVLLFFILLVIAQIFWFGGYGNMVSYGGFFLRLLTAYLVIKNIDQFAEVYVQIMFYLGIAALLFFGFFTVFPGIENTLFEKKQFWDNPGSVLDKSLIIYNIHKELLFGDQNNLGLFGLNRNAGPFWEPGAFGGYLMIAIIFQYLLATPKRMLKLLVFFAALFSTFSTTAFLAAFAFFVLMFIIKNGVFKSLAILTPIVVVAVLLIMNVDFIGGKITSQFSEFKEGSKYRDAEESDTRMGSANLDVEDFKRAPFFGTGPSDQTRYGPYETLFMRTNGLTDQLVRLGLVGFIGYLIFLYLSISGLFKNIGFDNHRPIGVIFVMMILIIGSSEIYFITPFFWGLVFLRFNDVGKVAYV